MQLLPLALVLSQAFTGSYTRDSYGVPHIVAPDLPSGFYFAGRAVAEDRLWQMELSRRIARGTLSEIMGPSGMANDRDVLATGYTTEELEAQIHKLSPEIQRYFEAYTKGINSMIEERTAQGKLPKEMTELGMTPQPWTAVDCAAVSVRLAKLFGAGGGGELRNYLLYYYLKGQKCAPKVLDVIDDFAWFNDPDASTTASKADDPLAKTHPVFTAPSRAITEAHIKQLPPSNLLELAPAIRVVEGQETRQVAEANNVFYKVGSYAVVVGKDRSKLGYPLLLSGPQMGHTNPAVVHEMSISVPQMTIAGMDVPGMPGILIGATKKLAWGFTSGVADLTDIFYFKKAGPDQVLIDGRTVSLEKISRTFQVKDGPSQLVVQMRVPGYGPVILDSKAGNAVYCRRDSYWQSELVGLSGVYGIYGSRTAAEAMHSMESATVSFNFFVAAQDGSIGWRYCGLVPRRDESLDPRFPIPGGKEHDWRGFIPADQMPHVLNPKSQLITNWNNKPASWWPNWDTPVWGSIFRDSLVKKAVAAPKLSPIDVEMVPWKIARQDDETDSAFLAPLVTALKGESLSEIEASAASYVTHFEGWKLNGSQAARIYFAYVRELKKALFLQHTGNFLSDATFNTVVQSCLLQRALNGKSHFDFLAGRSAKDVVLTAFRNAVKSLGTPAGSYPPSWLYQDGGFAAPDGSTVTYANRGSYIQILELGPMVAGRNILPPGVSESGAHSADQVDLAKSWTYKPMQGLSMP